MGLASLFDVRMDSEIDSIKSAKTNINIRTKLGHTGS
jgi:hypothetical protein